MRIGREDGARRATALLLALTAATACEAVGAGEGSRPDDGLLARPELRRVVELQSRRDGPGLVRLLEDPRPAVRARAAFALGSVQEPAAREGLEGLLEDPEPRVRADAAFGLGQLGDPGASPALLATLEREEDPTVRAELWHALGKTGDSTALAALEVRGLEGDEAATAALALARFGMRGVHDEEKIRWLGESLTAEHARLRRSAAYYFGRAPDPDVWVSQLPRVRDALDRYDPDELAAMYLLRGLGNLGRPPDAQRMVTWLEEGGDWRIRVEAARAIGVRMPLPPPIWVPLLEALDDPSRHVAVAAARVMATSLQPMERSANDMKEWIDAHPDDWRVARPLLVSLAMQREGEYVRSWLDRWSPEEHPGPWSAGIEALSHLRDEAAFRRLADAARSSSRHVAGPAVEALVRRWQDDRFVPAARRLYYEAFRDVLEEGDLRTAVAVAPALADTLLQPFGSVELLETAYRRMAMPEDVEPMVAILSALGDAGDPAAVPLLRDAAEHPHPVVRSAARSALAALEAGGPDAGDGADGGGGAGAGRGGSGPGARSPEALPDWEVLRELGSRPRLVLETRKGRFVVELDAEEAPVTVQTIARLAREGRLDGVAFHRVVPNFVIQGGDFERGDGFGGPGFTIPSEFTRIPFERGTIGMASAGKDTEGSQYFVTHGMQPHLDGRYTAFGRVVQGMEVVDRILEGDEVVRAAVEPSG